jgi:hypothetical protein
MKKLLFFILAVISINVSKAQITKTVGTLERGNPVLTIDVRSTINTYKTKLLELSGIDANFTTITVQSAKGNYYLVFSGDAHYKSTFQIIIEGESLKALAGTSCTTTDCASEPGGCSPQHDKNGSWCSSCSNSGKCTKTESTLSLLD